MKSIEKIVAVMLLFYLTGGLVPFLLGEGSGLDDPSDGNPASYVLQGTVMAIVLLLVATRWRRALALAMSAKWIVAIALLAVCSAVWSDAPLLTLRRSMLFLSTTTFGVYLGVRFSPREQVRLFCWALGIAMGLTIFMALVMPELGISHADHAGDWRGIFVQKNTLARTMVLAIVVFRLVEAHGYAKILKWAGVLTAGVLIVMSGSVTALAVLLPLFLIVPLASALKWRSSFLAANVCIGALAASAAGLVAFQYYGVLLNVMGRDATLTGRTDIWQSLFAVISDRPFLGYGFAAFWRGLQGPSASVILAVHWAVRNAHNGFLDLWLQLGLAGVGLFVIGYCSALFKALAQARSQNTLERLLPLTILAFVLFYNLTESEIVAPTSLFWALYVATCVPLFSRRAAEELEPYAFYPIDETDLACVPG